MKDEIISPIAIDLGAQYTGVVMPHYEAGQDLTSADISGALVVNTDKMTWSQQPRRQKRHQMRGYKRRKMAKKLFWLILEDEYGLARDKLPDEVVKFLNGLMNRRGFTYLSEELDESALQVPAAALTEITGGVFNADTPLEDQLARILADPAEARALLENGDLPANKTECKKMVPDQFKDDKKEIAEAWEQIRDACEQVDKSENDGHRPRRDYLTNIARDLEQSEMLGEVLPETLSRKKLARLMGHVNNLQLRVLRKYFNDKQMAGKGYWDPRRLHGFFFRWVKSWHAKKGSEEKESQRHLLALRDKHILGIFTETDPRTTIPPFEDQNNRRPPRCLSVRLSAERMDREHGQWRDWVAALVDRPENRYLQEELDANSASGQAAFLQRLVERSVALDPYQLRLLNSIGDHTQRREKPGYQALRNVLGDSVDAFLAFCEHFYRETTEARSGLWFDHEKRLLQVCNRVPKQKKNMKPQLLEAVLGIELTSEAVETLEKDFWNAPDPKIDRRNFRSWARLASEKQKEYGVHMKEAGEQQLACLESGQDLEDKDIAKLYKYADRIAALLADWYGMDAAEAKRFSSPHSLAQLFNIFEGDINGFNKTCARCTSENIWRMNEEDPAERVADAVRTELPRRIREQNRAARATRLSSDSTRPFDGQLAAIIEATAREIANEKLEQLSDVPDKSRLSVPLLVETNQFSFTDELAQTKRQRNSKAAQRARDLAEKSAQRWQDKYERIRDASRGICPYTGASLGSAGEIDHIVPRSLSRDTRDTVFNSEANLIYCSARGNNLKGTNIWNLDDLDQRYLKAQFGTADPEAVHAEIERRLSPYLQHGKPVRAFSELPETEQVAFRHALFDEELRGRVSPLLEQGTRTRVNGTQAWLAKRIQHRLYEGVRHRDIELNVTAHPVEPADAHYQRALLAEVDSRWEKHDQQPAMSHVVDGACVLLHALEAEKTAPVLQTISSASFELPDWRLGLLPDVVDVRRLEPRPKYRRDNPGSAPIFKDGIYGERFLPLLLDADELRAGYSPENSVPVQNPAFVFEALAPWLRFAKRALEEGDYGSWRGKAEEQGLLYFEVDRSAAFEFLGRDRVSLTEEELVARALLDSLRFEQQKVPVEQALLDAQGRKLETRDRILKEADFTIKVNPPGKPVPRKTGASGKVTLPALEHWRVIVDDPDVAPRLGGKAPEDRAFWEKIHDKHFPRQKPERHHKKVRKTFSLPRVKSPSGGFRVERKAPDGRHWQLVESEGFSAAGFALRNGTADFSTPAPLPLFTYSPSLTPLADQQPLASNEIVYFDEWIKVVVPEEYEECFSEIYYSPGSRDRFEICFGMTQSQFKDFFVPTLELDIDSPYDLPADIKIKEKPVRDSWKRKFGKILGSPRSDQPLYIKALRLGENNLFQISGSPTAEMKRKYSESYAASHHH